MRYSGTIGYVTDVETVPGVWSPNTVERKVKGTFIRAAANNNGDDVINTGLSLGHRMSIIGDAFTFDNYFDIKWISVDGRKWEVKSVEIQRPRLIVSVGGLWTHD